jgi:hypothetical protein
MRLVSPNVLKTVLHAPHFAECSQSSSLRIVSLSHALTRLLSLTRKIENQFCEAPLKSSCSPSTCGQMRSHAVRRMQCQRSYSGPELSKQYLKHWECRLSSEFSSDHSAPIPSHLVNSLDRALKPDHNDQGLPLVTIACRRNGLILPGSRSECRALLGAALNASMQGLVVPQCSNALMER